MERQKILVIDDEVDIARLLVEELEVDGFSASYVETGEEGMESARKIKPDLILLDWKLPDMEGIDVCRILKSEEETEDIPIIMLTSQSSEKDKIKGLEVGADDYVTKPFSSGELLARIKGILKRVKKREKVVEKEVEKLQKYMPKHMIEKILSTGKMEGEIRNVTVLFGDISGFTSMSEKMDPEEVRTMMNKCFELLAGIIYKYEGTVDKFIGDAVMAIFGAPIAHEDDPPRAVRAALEMQDKLEKLESKVPIKMSIGINSGTVVAGSVGADMKMEYTVMGDTVNLTSRLQTLAEPGQILISENTHARTSEEFEFKKLEPVQVKGKEKLVQPYEVIERRKVERRKAERRETETIEGLKVPEFVGRDRELEILKRSVDKLFSDQPKGQILSISGDIGIGKSRIIHELDDYIKEKNIIFLRGIGITYGVSIPYLIFKEFLQLLFEITKDTIISEILLLLEGSDFSEEKKKKIHTAIRDLFGHHAESKPLLLLFANIHWLDSASLELLNYLNGEIEKSPILIICIYRRGFTHKWQDKIYYREIELDELSSDDLKVMLSSNLVEEELSDTLKEMIIKKSEGNPFFLREIIKSLIDKKVIEQIEGKWVNRKEIEMIEIPVSITAVLMPGLDILGQNEKKLLQIASCMGRSFKYKIISSIYGDEEKLKTAIANLKKKDLIIEKSVYPEREYTFRQTVTRDVIYNSLLLSRRQELEEEILKRVKSEG